MLRNVPCGQIIRIKRNFTFDQDFLEQSEIIKQNCIQKFYREETIDQEILEILAITQEQCLLDKERNNNENNKQWHFISDFHCQYREIEIIF